MSRELICHTDLVLCGVTEAVKGRGYTVIDENSDCMTFIDESGDRHDVWKNGIDSKTSYKEWFIIRNESRIQTLINELKELTGSKEISFIK